jgi:solute carrier family 38 (sodium-coupled neutral amino acid transporter), member 11
MFGQRSRHEPQGEASEPLLNESNEDHVVFSADDDDELDDEDLPLALSKDDRQEQQGHVRFREEVQVIAPPMRSTTASREAGAH